MKKSELLFIAILVPLDAIMLLFAALATYYVRYRTDVERLLPEGYEIDLNVFLIAAGISIPLFLIIFALAGLYNTRSRRSGLDEFVNIFFAVSSGFMGIIILIFIEKELFISSRFIVIGSWIASIIFMTIGRLVIRYAQEFFYRCFRRSSKLGIGVVT